jgi:hypothetical protein
MKANYIISISLNSLELDSQSEMNSRGQYGACISYLEQNAIKIGSTLLSGGIYLVSHENLFKLLCGKPHYNPYVEIEVFKLANQESQLMPFSNEEDGCDLSKYRLPK